ncbi:hypothetical protein LguiA_032610 [Lonicera macranthoides]
MGEESSSHLHDTEAAVPNLVGLFKDASLCSIRMAAEPNLEDSRLEDCNNPVAPQYDIVRSASQGVTHPGISLVQARLTSEFSWDPKPVSYPKGLVLN